LIVGWVWNGGAWLSKSRFTFWLFSNLEVSSQCHILLLNNEERALPKFCAPGQLKKSGNLLIIKILEDEQNFYVPRLVFYTTRFNRSPKINIMIDTIITDVQSINAQSTPAQNLQTALSIATRQKLSTVNSFTTAERTQLEAIAAQCVEQGGDGVLLARALLQWPNIQEPCSTNSALVRPDADNATAVSSAELFPNPTQSKLWLRTAGLEDRTPVRLELYTATGQLILQQSFLPNHQQEVGVANYPAGVYFYRLHQSGVVLGRGKLVVQ
jgi:hypothetical protein